MAGVDASWQSTLHAFQEAAAAFQDLVSEIPSAAWPTPALGVWSVRDLVGHAGRAFVTVASYPARPAASITLESGADYLPTALASDPNVIAERGRQAGQALGDDPPAAIADRAARALSVVRAADPDAVVATPFGGIRVRDYLPARTFELAVQGLDLVTASDCRPGVLPPRWKPASAWPARSPCVPARPATCCWRCPEAVGGLPSPERLSGRASPPCRDLRGRLSC
jgi:hypothetical protein